MNNSDPTTLQLRPLRVRLVHGVRLLPVRQPVVRHRLRPLRSMSFVLSSSSITAPKNPAAAGLLDSPSMSAISSPTASAATSAPRPCSWVLMAFKRARRFSIARAHPFVLPVVIGGWWGVGGAYRRFWGMRR